MATGTELASSKIDYICIVFIIMITVCIFAYILNKVGVILDTLNERDA
jgi:hypothetical protein